MKNFAKILSVATLAIASVSAHAVVINGAANFNESETLTATSVTFNNGAGGAFFTLYEGQDTANNFGFAASGNGLTPIQFTFNTITFATLSAVAPQTLFTYTNPSTLKVTSFAATAEQALILATSNSSGYLYLLGVLTVDGQAVPASFALTELPNSGNAATNTGTSVLQVPPAALTPEPNSLVLLGTGLVSAAGMMFRKRQAV
jgi:hypothetical protein